MQDKKFNSTNYPPYLSTKKMSKLIDGLMRFNVNTTINDITQLMLNYYNGFIKLIPNEENFFKITLAAGEWTNHLNLSLCIINERFKDIHWRLTYKNWKSVKEVRCSIYGMAVYKRSDNEKRKEDFIKQLFTITGDHKNNIWEKKQDILDPKLHMINCDRDILYVKTSFIFGNTIIKNILFTK